MLVFATCARGVLAGVMIPVSGRRGSLGGDAPLKRSRLGERESEKTVCVALSFLDDAGVLPGTNVVLSEGRLKVLEHANVPWTVVLCQLKNESPAEARGLLGTAITHEWWSVVLLGADKVELSARSDGALLAAAN